MPHYFLGMTHPHSCSLVTPTYNWPEALELLLLSVLNQTVLPNEVLIADDGSRPDTQALIEKFQTVFPVPLRHIWHEDVKNRKPMIMNKAIAQAQFEYIVEIDGDIILNKHFIADHLRFAQKGHYLFGSRANITQSHLPKLFAQKQIEFNVLSSGIKKRGRTIRLPFMMNWAQITASRSSKLRGCNMSFWREDFIQINGFNENLVGWGIDDSEMIERMHNIGILGKRLKFAGLAYHIYHPEQSKSHIAINNEIEAQTKSQKLTFIEKGVQQYL